jgi:hypothetical protein
LWLRLLGCERTWGGSGRSELTVSAFDFDDEVDLHCHIER